MSIKVEAIVQALSLKLREAWEERSAIRQYEAGLDRDIAEFLALVDLANMYQDALIETLQKIRRG